MEQEKHIRGIYNYCDRWCERCELSSKCLLYEKEQKRLAMHKEKGEDPGALNVVMQDVKESFDEALRLVCKSAEKYGIDINSLPKEEYKEYDPSAHPLMKAANNYLKMTKEFLEKLRKTTQEEGVELTKRVEIIPSAISDIEILRQIVSSYEVISWYNTLIPVKIHRALQGKIEADEFAKSDADGSAKVAYLGVMKSMEALKTIYEWDEDLQDEALTLLAKLENLQKDINKEFPGHITFKRQGFDD